MVLLNSYSKAENLLITVLYRQPDNTSGGHPSTSIQFMDAMDKLEEAITKSSNKSSNMIIYVVTLTCPTLLGLKVVLVRVQPQMNA